MGGPLEKLLRNPYTTKLISEYTEISEIKIFHQCHLTPSLSALEAMGTQLNVCIAFSYAQLFPHFGLKLTHSTVLDLPNILHPKHCLLGIFGELTVRAYIKDCSVYCTFLLILS